MTGGAAVIGYVRVSTDGQGESGLGLEAQEATIRDECGRRGWKLLRVEQDVASGKTAARPGLKTAIRACTEGEAQGVVAARLDRLTRSVVDLANLLGDATNHGYNVVCIDAGVDLSTPSGEFLANVLASASQYERRIIGQRTKDALAVAKANGTRLGRPPLLPDDLAKRLVRMKNRGMSLRQIAAKLNADGVPTPGGAKEWTHSGVHHVLRRKSIRERVTA